MTLPILLQLGERVRAERQQRGLTQRQLSVRSGLSLRFLAQIERGEGNISLVRFANLAAALDMGPAQLLADTGCLASARRQLIALLGLRGAGKSTVGRALAMRLAVPFVELDGEIERMAGLSLGEIFELHGESYYRRLEREALQRIVDGLAPGHEHPQLVMSTGGSLVSDRETFRLLRDHAVTVWLSAEPEDHWNRVIKQGDQRPMAENPQAFAELRALLAVREPLYATADHRVQTSATAVSCVVEQVEKLARSA